MGESSIEPLPEWLAEAYEAIGAGWLVEAHDKAYRVAHGAEESGDGAMEEVGDG